VGLVLAEFHQGLLVTVSFCQCGVKCETIWKSGDGSDEARQKTRPRRYIALARTQSHPALAETHTPPRSHTLSPLQTLLKHRHYFTETQANVPKLQVSHVMVVKCRISYIHWNLWVHMVWLG